MTFLLVFFTIGTVIWDLNCTRQNDFVTFDQNMLGNLYLRPSSRLHCKRFLAVICVQWWAGTKMMHPNSACQWQIESPSPGKSMNNPATMHIFLQITLHLLSFWPQWQQWTPPEAWEKKYLLMFTPWSSTCFEFSRKFSRSSLWQSEMKCNVLGVHCWSL